MEQIIKNKTNQILNQIYSQYIGKNMLYFAIKVRLDFNSTRWPYNLTKLKKQDQDIFLWPKIEGFQPAIILPIENLDIRDMEQRNMLHEFALRILSTLSWVEQADYEEESYPIIGSSINIPYSNTIRGDRVFNYDLPLDDFDYFPLPEDKKAQKALALYREALHNNNIFYKFLGFVKILNITLKSSSDHIDWINNNFGNAIKINPWAQDFLRKLSSTDIGKDIYERGRCAIAHANEKDYSVDPDDPRDRQRIYETLPLMQALAQYFIETKLGIKTIQTIKNEHLFELAGFKQKLDKKLLAKIIKGKDLKNINSLLEEKFSKDFPVLSFKIRGIDNDINANLLLSKVSYIDNGLTLIKYTSSDQKIMVQLYLNFLKEKVVYDWKSRFNVRDSEDLEAYSNIVKQAQFIKSILCNGVLEIWHNNYLLSRTLPHMETSDSFREDMTYLDEKFSLNKTKISQS
jgi:hypothetical protein